MFSSILLIAISLSGAAEPTATADDVIFCNRRDFKIPLDLEKDRNPSNRIIRLYVSKDRGKSWVVQSEAPLTTEMITYRASQDGDYWFVLTIVDSVGKQNPPDVTKVSPLRVLVDTKKPDLVVKPIRTKAGRRGFRWECEDANANLATLRFAVWDDKLDRWQEFPLPISEKKLCFFEEGQTCSKIQATVKDRCDNESIIQVEIAGDQFAKKEVSSFVLNTPINSTNAGYVESTAEKPSFMPETPAWPRMPDPEVSAAHHVGSVDVKPTVSAANIAPPKPEMPAKLSRHRKVTVNYVLDEKDKSAGSRIELWGTHNQGSEWKKLATDVDGVSPAEVELPSDGVWGLLMVVQNPNQPIDQLPGPGSKPELQVDIDTEPPMLEMARPEVVGGKVTVRWNAADKHLATTPIDLFGSYKPAGPWKKIAVNLDNTGEYVWDFQREGVSGQVYFRVRARDQAGNVTSAQSPSVVELPDMSPAKPALQMTEQTKSKGYEL